jgi:hypothetical protein
VLRGEDDAEGRDDDVEGGIRVWEALRIADVESDIDAIPVTCAPVPPASNASPPEPVPTSRTDSPG